MITNKANWSFALCILGTRFLSSTAFTLLSFSVPCCVCVYGWLVGQLFFVVEYLATQTGGATVWSHFSLIFGYHIGGGSTVNRVVKSVIRKFLKLATPLVPSSGEIINGGVGGSEDRLEPNLIAWKQTVTPCHLGGWGSLDSISGKDAEIRLYFSPLTEWLSGLQFITGISLSQAGRALGRSTPQLILTLAKAVWALVGSGWNDTRWQL